MTKKPKKNPEDIEYERLGRLLREVYEIGFIDRARFYRMNLVRGVLVGFGSVIGATILIAILLGVLRLFDEAPLLGPFIESFRETIKEN